MAMTKLTNLMNPEVMGDWVSEHLEKEMKFSPLCRVDFTLAGRAGDTVTVPKYAYIGDAGEVAEGDAITISQLTASSETVTVKKAGNGVELTDEAYGAYAEIKRRINAVLENIIARFGEKRLEHFLSEAHEFIDAFNSSVEDAKQEAAQSEAAAQA